MSCSRSKPSAGMPFESRSPTDRNRLGNSPFKRMVKSLSGPRLIVFAISRNSMSGDSETSVIVDSPRGSNLRFERSRRAGEFRNDVDCVELARFVMTVIQGFGVQATGGGDTTAITTGCRHGDASVAGSFPRPKPPVPRIPPPGAPPFFSDSRAGARSSAFNQPLLFLSKSLTILWVGPLRTEPATGAEATIRELSPCRGCCGEE